MAVRKYPWVEERRSSQERVVRRYPWAEGCRSSQERVGRTFDLALVDGEVEALRTPSSGVRKLLEGVF